MPRFLYPSSLGFALHKDYQFPPHLQRVQEFVLNTVFTSGGEGILTLPVRHGKSFMCSYLLPAWLLLVRPETRILTVSHSARWSEIYSGMPARAALKYFGTGASALHPDFQSRGNFKTVAGGGLFATGEGTSLAGTGYDLIICDDLIKDTQHAASPTRREQLIEWIGADLLTRREKSSDLGKCSVISILSRRHPRDPAGFFQELGWPELHMPALDENDNALWPAKFSAEELIKIREDYENTGQSWIFSNLYQGHAVDPASVAFDPEWLKDLYIDEPPTGGINILAIDPSHARNTEQKSNDPCAMVLINVNTTTGRIVVVDGIIRKMPVTHIVDEAMQLIQKYRPSIVSCETIDLQWLLLQQLEERLKEAKLIYSTNLKSYEPKTDKCVRIELTLAPLLAQGRIKIMRKPILRPLLTELEQFPHSLHDDAVDSLTQACWNAVSLYK